VPPLPFRPPQLNPTEIAGLVPKREREISLLSVTEIGTAGINHFCDRIGAMLKYTVILIPEDEGGYSVDVPALPGCYTQGETKLDIAKRLEELEAKHGKQG